jgi:hypothetical protein
MAASTAVPLTITNLGTSKIAESVTAGGWAIGATAVLTYPWQTAGPGWDFSSWADGPNALVSETATGGNNTALGDLAGEYISTSQNNTAIGNSAMMGLTGAKLTGSQNTAVGQAALTLIQGAATQDTAVGAWALEFNSIGTANTAVGMTAMQGISGTPLTGGQNTALGVGALMTIQGAAAGNTAVGWNSLIALTTSTNNTAVGYQALTSAPTRRSAITPDNTSRPATTTLPSAMRRCWAPPR